MEGLCRGSSHGVSVGYHCESWGRVVVQAPAVVKLGCESVQQGKIMQVPLRNQIQLSSRARTHRVSPSCLRWMTCPSQSRRSETRLVRKSLLAPSGSVSARVDLDCRPSVAARDEFGPGEYSMPLEELCPSTSEDALVASHRVVRNEKQSIYELENLIQGDFGKHAFLLTLLMGVGVSCLISIGDADAATSHINNGALDVDMRALALGPEGPLVEEFWDNMRRYGLYFLTVVTGGFYTLVKPAIDALRNPLSAVLIIIIVSGSFYLVSLTVSAMLGINEFKYDYAG